MSFHRKQLSNIYILFSRFEANRKTDKNADGVVSDIKGAKTSY